jgi:TIR domain-containing protein
VYRAPLTVHVVWHPAFERGVAYGRELFRHFFEDPDDLSSHGLRIPVFHWRSTGERRSDVEPPRDIPLATAERAIVVPLIDSEFLGGLGWDDFLVRTADRLRDCDLLVPVELAGGVPAGIDATQAIRLAGVPDRLRLGTLLTELTHRIWGLLDPDDSSKVPAFISYAVSDGQHIAERVRDYIGSRGTTAAFFAARDIPSGDPWRDELRRQAARSLLLAIRTDGYAARPWCQIEVLEAKRAGMPVVVLDALARREARGFPYLGNGPVLRWRSRDPDLLLEELLGLMLREALRFRYFRQRVDALRALRHIDVAASVQPSPPELLTMLDGVAAGHGSPLMVYPDPPLGADELGVIRRLNGEVQPVTPLMLLAS